MARRILVIAVIMLCAAAPAWADVAALSYTDTANQAQTVSPSQQYINPAGAVSLYLTAGLDRKVGFVLKDSAGQTVAAGVSGLITASDTITVLGQTYYGKVLSIPATLAEGNYTLTGQVLTSGGTVVSSQNYALVVDRTPPTAGELWWWFRPSYFAPTSIMNNELVSGHQMRQVWVKNVSDGGGVASVLLEFYDPSSNQVISSKPGWYNSITQEAGLGSSSSFPEGVLPDMDGPLGVRFVITDRAGNRTVAQAVVRYDGTCNPLPELVAVHDPNATGEFIPGSGLVGYVAYTPGMTVHENPVKLLYRLPRSNWLDENPDYGLTAVGGALAHVGAEHVYFVFTVPWEASGYLNPNVWKINNPRWFSSGTLSYNLALSPSVPASPKLLGHQVYRTDIGWVPFLSHYLNSSAVQVTKLRAQVEARPYDQVVTFTGTSYLYITPCTVPAGETECTADLTLPPPAPGTITYYSRLLQVKSADNTLYTTTLPNFYVLYDLMPPEITSYDLNQASKQVTFDVTEPMTGAGNGVVRLLGGGVRAVNQATSEVVTLQGALVSLGGDNSRITVSYAALPEGDWQIILQAWDRSQNLAERDLGVLALDATPPAVEIYREGVALSDHEAVDSLGKVSFTVTDAVDANPVVESVRLTGGPQGTDVYLAYRLENGAYWLEYPVLYPSQGQEYLLEVAARDGNGNRTVKTLAFSYEPPTVQLSSGGAETLNLPAIPAAVVHPDGSNVLVSQPVQVGGQAVSGQYDLVVMSGPNSTVPVVVGGLVVSPGEQKTIAGYDFGAKGGRLDLPVWSEQAGRVNLLVTSLAPNFPVMVVPLNFWKPQLQLSADPGWEVQPLVQAHKISFAPGSGTPCQVVLDEGQAKAADPVSAPACLVEITAKPSGYSLKDGVLQGYVQADGPADVEYHVSLYNGGAKYVMASGSQAITRLPITDVSLDVPAPAPPVYQKVQDISLQAKSSGRLPCRVTADQAEAERYGAYEVACLVRWFRVPAGLQSDASLPVLSGRLDNAGGQELSWIVDVYTPAGRAEWVAAGTLEFTAVAPPVPTFALQPGLYAQALDAGNIVVMAEGGGDVGSVQFKPPMDNTSMTLKVEVDGAAESYEYKSSRAITFSRYVRLGALPVWSQKTLKVTLGYTDMPEKQMVQTYRVTVAPPKRLEAYLTADRFGSSTTGLGVKLQVGSRTREGFTYDKALHGEWEVEFGYIEGVGDYRPMTTREALPATGVLAKTLNPPLGNVKLVAVLTMKPPEGASFYSRTLLSNKTYAQVLKGDAPVGEISSAVASGPAPLVAMSKLKVDTENQKILGRVAWQMSRDNGATWEDLTGVQPYMAQLKLNPGQYVVRAELENRFSGAKGYTNQLAFTAYDVPEVAVSGPNAVIVNTPLTLQASLTNKGAAVAAEEAVIQWYRHDRDGDTLVHTGAAYTVTPDAMGNYQYVVRAALKSAVASDAKAWRQAVKIVRVVPPSPPEVRVLAPSSMEYNTKEAQAYKLQAVVSLRSGLDLGTYPVEGEWELPDGSKVAVAELSYSPTAADASKRKSLIVYRAWLKGMKETTTKTVVKSIPLTIYEWPTFSLQTNQDHAVAPSLVTLTVMPSTGKPWTLEKPEYTWSLPEGAEIVRTLDNGRIVQAVFSQPGSQDVSVSVKDARGSTATAAATVELAAAPPFVVSFQPLYSNADKREPLSVAVRARFSGGHPADRILSVAYGTKAPGATVNQSLGYVQGLPAGSHTITVTATSKFGQTVTGALPVEVQANQPPSCTVSSRADARYRYLEASCSDPDGRIAAYRWYLNGRVVGCSNRLTQSLADTAKPVYFEAIDDSGAKYQETVNAN